jgi:hypothetical protein
MKILRSTWFVALIALALGAGLQTQVLLSKVDGLLAEAAVAREVEAEGPPKRIDWNFLSPEMEELRDELRNRVASVSQREDELRDYEKRLQAEKAEIEKIKREIEAETSRPSPPPTAKCSRTAPSRSFARWMTRWWSKSSPS